MSLSAASQIVDVLDRTLPSSAGLPVVMDVVRESLGAEIAFCYQPVATLQGWDLQNCCYRGSRAESRRASHVGWVRSLPSDSRSMGNYAPYDVATYQRNRALALADLRKLPEFDPTIQASAAASASAQSQDQLRVLLCDGGRVTAWLGVLREEPFLRDDRATLQAATSALHGWLRLASRAQLHAIAAVEALIDAVPGHAFVVNRADGVEHMNRAARALFATQRDAVGAAVQAARAGRAYAGMTVTRLDDVSHGYLLIVLTADDCERPFRAGRAWNATPKQLRILELLAQGKSNKDIASTLSCAEVTVESHLTRLFRLSGARSRVELLSLMSRF